MIPLDDLDWAANQKPAVFRLFVDCWRSDPYGSRWMQMSTKLKKTAFTEAKSRLSQHGLFIFKPEPSIQDGRSNVCWMVRNLHGSRVKEFWKEFANTNSNPSATDFEFADTNHKSGITNSEFADTNLEFADTNSISPQTRSEQGFQDRSISSQHHIHDQQQFNSAEDGVVVERCAFENKEKEKAINEIRRLGIERNESVLALLKKYDVNVPDALAYIQQRQGEGETFGNITGAFVDALKKGNSPSHTEPSFGLHKDINPPTEQQLQALEDARGGSLILDYFFSSLDNTYKVILLDGITQMPWWEYLEWD